MQICIRPSWCHCHSLSLAPVKSRLVSPFWYRLTQVVLEKRPLNGCSSSCIYYFITYFYAAMSAVVVWSGSRCSWFYHSRPLPSDICRKHAFAHCSLQYSLNRSRQMPAVLSVPCTATHIIALSKSVKWTLSMLHWLSQNIFFQISQ